LRNLEAARRTLASDQADLWEKTIDYQRDQELGKRALFRLRPVTMLEPH
jgi:hypothetical protein